MAINDMIQTRLQGMQQPEQAANRLVELAQTSETDPLKAAQELNEVELALAMTIQLLSELAKKVNGNTGGV